MNAIPPWVLMWSLALLLWTAGKLASLVPSRWARAASRGRIAAYFLGWPGMNAESFVSASKRLCGASGAEWRAAAVKTLFGILLTWVVARRAEEWAPALAGWVGMIGLTFCLHFGLFHLLSLVWRARGFEAPPLMDRPHRATSLAEFWGRRWNTGFHELAMRFVFRPLRERIGARPALLAAFLASGWVHELVITVPARAGWGGPTAYFLIQGAGVLFARTSLARRIGLSRGCRGWWFTMITVVTPVPLLFPAPFVERVIRPFLHVIHAL